MRHLRSQPKLPKGTVRIPSASALAPQVRHAVEQEARHFGVSKSFVMAVAIAEALGITLPYHYAVPQQRPRMQRPKTQRTLIKRVA